MAEQLEAELALDYGNAADEAESQLGRALEAAVSAFGDGLTEALSRLGNVDPVEIPVSADTSAADQALDQFAVLAEAPLDVPVDADTADALSALDELGDAVEPVDVEVTADVEDAQAAIDSIGTEETVEVGVEADTSEAQAAVDDLISDTEAQSAEVTVTATVTGASEVEDLGDDVEDLGTSAEDTATKTSTLSDATGGLGTVATLATGNLRDYRTVLGGAAGGLAVLTGATLGFFAAGMEAESITRRFRSALGEFADDVQRIDVGSLTTDFEGLGEALGADAEGLMQASTASYQFATAAGLSGQQASRFTEQLIAIASNAVALNPSLGDVGSATDRLRLALARGNERGLQPFKLGLSSTEIQAAATQIALDNGRTSVTSMDRALAGATLAVEKFGPAFAENIARATKDPQIQMRIFADQLENIAEDLGRPLISPMLELMEHSIPVAEQASRVLGTLGQAALPALTSAIDAVVVPLRIFADVLAALPPELTTALSLSLLLGRRFGEAGTATRAFGSSLLFAYPLLQGVNNDLASTVLTAGILGTVGVRGITGLGRALGTASSGFLSLAAGAEKAGLARTSAALMGGATAASSMSGAVAGLGAAALAAAPALVALAPVAPLIAMSVFGKTTSGVNTELEFLANNGVKKVAAEFDGMVDILDFGNERLGKLHEGNRDLARSFGELARGGEQAIKQLRASGQVGNQVANDFSVFQTKMEDLAGKVRAVAEVSPDLARKLIEAGAAAGLGAQQIEVLNKAAERGEATYQRRAERQREAAAAAAIEQQSQEALTAALIAQQQVAEFSTSLRNAQLQEQAQIAQATIGVAHSLVQAGAANAENVYSQARAYAEGAFAAQNYKAALDVLNQGTLSLAASQVQAEAGIINIQKALADPKVGANLDYTSEAGNKFVGMLISATSGAQGYAQALAAADGNTVRADQAMQSFSTSLVTMLSEAGTAPEQLATTLNALGLLKFVTADTAAAVPGLTEAIAALGPAGASAAGGVAMIGPATEAAVAQALAAAGTSLPAIGALIRTEMANGAASFQEAIDRLPPAAQAALSAASAATGAGMVEIATASAQGGEKAAGDFDSAYTEGAKGGAEHATEAAASVIAAEQKVSSEADNWGQRSGRRFGESFARAIRNQTDEAYAAGQALARAAKQGADNAGSPSEHLFYDSGTSQAEAYALGLTRSTPAVVRAAEEIVRAAYATMEAGQLPGVNYSSPEEIAIRRILGQPTPTGAPAGAVSATLTPAQVEASLRRTMLNIERGINTSASGASVYSGIEEQGYVSPPVGVRSSAYWSQAMVDAYESVRPIAEKIALAEDAVTTATNRLESARIDEWIAGVQFGEGERLDAARKASEVAQAAVDTANAALETIRTGVAPATGGTGPSASPPGSGQVDASELLLRDIAASLALTVEIDRALADALAPPLPVRVVEMPVQRPTVEIGEISVAVSVPADARPAEVQRAARAGVDAALDAPTANGLSIRQITATIGSL